MAAKLAKSQSDVDKTKSAFLSSHGAANMDIVMTAITGECDLVLVDGALAIKSGASIETGSTVTWDYLSGRSRPAQQLWHM